ncbi:MAG: PEP-CTERM sorting domain-containing protein, partial [Pirellulales bacterium]|nr:PEP-CTERM sorting domain-containing protein [Pirellulales bacterium]
FEPDGTLDEIEFSGDTGNYIVYESLTNSSLKVQTWGKGFTHLGITGFQIRFSNAEPPAVLADYPLGSVSSGVTDRSSSDTEPLTFAGDVTGGFDPVGDAGGISLPGGEYTAFDSDEAFTGEDLLEFTIELDQATSMSMRKLEFSIDLEGDGSVNNYALRSSADGFVDDIVDADLYSIARPGSTTKTIGLTGVAGLQDLQDDVTFRLAFYGGWASTDSGALLTSLQVTGTVEGDAGTPGDFDEDGDVDGADFLIWQRGDSPDGGSAEEYADWQANFGTVDGAAQAMAVPEPTALMLLGLGGILLLMYRRSM